MIFIYVEAGEQYMIESVRCMFGCGIESGIHMCM